MKKDDEQAILDAYWSGFGAGDKLKSKIMERMKRVNKVNNFQPLTTRAKTPGHQGGLRKKLKKDTSKLVLMVQETGKPGVANADSCKSLNRTQSKPLFSPSYAKPTTSNSISKRPSVNTSIQNIPNNTKEGMRDASAYLTLREQLDKLTMEIQSTDYYEQQDESVSYRKQRRTRKERGKGKRDMSMAIDDTSTLSAKRTPSLLNSARGPEKTIRFTFDTTPKSKSGIEGGKIGKPPINSSRKVLDKIAKENKPNTGQKINLLKKDPRTHLVRKYLGDLYSKVMFKVKNIERNKKTVTKRILEKCPSSRQELHNNPKVFAHAHKKSLQYNEKIKKI